MNYEVIKNYNDAPQNPISIMKGELLSFVEESDPNGDWANWIFCKGSNKEGWIPKQILEVNDLEVLVTEDYNAKEHNLKIGDILKSEKELNGWIWCLNKGELAWAPLNHTKKI